MPRQQFRSHRPLFTKPKPPKIEEPKKKWRLPGILWRALKKTATVFGFIFIIYIAASIFLFTRFLNESAPKLPDEMVLYIELDKELRERPADGGFASAFIPPEPSVHDYVSLLEHARDDDRVRGLLVRMDNPAISLAHVHELRAAVKAFKADGKFAYLYSPSFATNSLGAYYLAAAFDEIWLQPMGILSLPGVSFQIPFFAGVLEKLGVEPNFFQREEYKTVYENMTRTEMSAESREMSENMLAVLTDAVVRDVAADRSMRVQQFQSLVDQALFNATDAAREGLIDHADYADVLVSKIREQVTGNPEDKDLPFIFASTYMNVTSNERLEELMASIGRKQNTSKVAVIYVNGMILSKSLENAALGGQAVAAASDIAPAILDAGEDKAVEAIILRVNSPGGSPVASESILRAVERAKNKGKQVFVSMGPVAASGGYWVSAYADKIFASPMTVTGSIGVAGGKFALQELWGKVGVNWDGVNWGENADLWSFNQPFDEAGAARFNAMLDHTYEQFLERVAKGRNMPVESVREIAKGRVWTGKDALQVGLVDELGTLNDTLDYAAQTLGHESRNDLKIQILPKPKTPYQQFLDLLQGSASLPAQFGEALAPVMAFYALGQQAQHGGVTYEPLATALR